MTINLNPETQRVIQQDVARGSYNSPEEFVEAAVRLLHEQEDWFEENRDDFGAKIEEGYASAQLGKLTDEVLVRSRMQERKRAWLADNPNR